MKEGLPLVVVLTRLAIDPSADSDLRQLEKDETPKFLESAWLEDRVSHLIGLTLCSLRNQTRFPDLHLIAVDERVANQVVSLLTDKLPDFSEILVLEGGISFNEAVRSRLLAYSNDVVSVRLDSDDALAPKFIESLATKSREGEALNFPHGVQWVVSRGHLFHRLILSNPTIAYRSKNENHVFDFGRHRLVMSSVPTKNIWTFAPMFLKLAHAQNHAGFQRGGVPAIRPARALDRFGIQYESLSSNLRFRPDSIFHWIAFLVSRRFPRLDKVANSLFARIGSLLSRNLGG